MGEEMQDFGAMLREIAERPALYVGRVSLRAVGHYLDGYDQALRDAGIGETPLRGWSRWVESRFLISHPAWHWTRILVHAYGNDHSAIAALPQLFDQFLIERRLVGVEGIEAELNRRLIAEYGQDWHAPTEAETTT
jgi:hypothetical protein